MPRPVPAPSLDPVLEILDTAACGEPRWVVADARSGPHALTLARRLAAEAEHRGFVAIDVDRYRRATSSMLQVMDGRTIFLVAGPASPPAMAAAALAHCAARAARPHVLLTIRTHRQAGQALVVREARAAYGGASGTSRSSPTLSLDAAKHVARGARAGALEREGRHAAAERLLRDVAGALTRRGAWPAGVRTLLRLARLLIERGRPADADAVCDEAADAARRAADGAADADVRIWQVIARTDAARLSDADSLCRAVLLGTLSPARAAWARAALARILLSQARIEEACRIEVAPSAEPEPDVGPVPLVCASATRVRLLLAAGSMFEAGLEMRRVRDLASAHDHPLLRIIAGTTQLRLRAAAGDLVAAEQTLGEICVLARQAHVPLRASRARLIWYDALRRAGDERRARAELRYLERVRRVAPPLLRNAIDLRLDGRDTAAVRPAGERDKAGSTWASSDRHAVALLRITHEEPTDAQAVRRILAWLVDALRPARLEVWSCDAGPATALVAAGSGLAPQLGARVLESGIPITERVQGGAEMALPIRHGARLLAALAARWPVDREPPPDAAAVLELAAHVLAAPVEAMLADARLSAGVAADVPELLGGSAAMIELRRAVRRAAAAPFAVLIEGESGSGKELVARAIHQLSARRERRFCDVNCAALPDDLLESELFGHARGAFTGAVAERAGLFEEASGGTLFLDELPDLSARGQAKLLRAIQQQEVRRVGESFSRPVDVRLVTAANRDMRREADEGRFRLDLIYRLDVIRIRIPPLRERAEDVTVLAEHFWRGAAGRVGTRATLTHGALAALARYHWPGNVRELQNAMAALAVAAPASGRVRESLLPAAMTGAASITAPRLEDARTQFERRWVEAALARAAGNRSRAAAELGLSRQGLVKTLARLGIGSG